MSHLNYKHLRYFWMVAREGSIARASELLHLTPQTISGQLGLLEKALGAKLFAKLGRNLVLTEDGHAILSYADEIFQLGTELEDRVKRSPGGPVSSSLVGIAEMVPKLIAYQVLDPALRLPEPVRMVCTQDNLESLLANLAVHKLDLVLADSPVSPGLNLRLFNHLLGECGATFFATKALAESCRGNFPDALSGMPLLLPTRSSAMRLELDAWLDRKDVRPLVVGEFDDSALMKTFGQAGAGVFFAPTAIEREVVGQHRVEIVGRSEQLRFRYYAISAERRLRHPAVVAISAQARNLIFGSGK